ncbi:MAG: gliding motility-associated C-terminal domain-containing protein, partial [Flavobacteriales bacterium]|nr:gliding motility-associated C-terminal domain-containing protein [Flavobacteriales bacterium]
AMLITPTANDLTRSVCEDILGSGTTSGVNLTGNNSAINSGAGLTFTWYTDNGLTTPVASPSNATVNNGDIFYVEVDNGNCTNTAQVTYSVTSTITLTDPQTEVCEDVLGGGTYSGFDLTSLNGSVYSGSGATTYNWFESDMSTAVATPTNITLSDGDQYYIEVADGNCSNSVMLTFTVNALPTVTSVPTLELCDEGSSQATFDLTSAQSGVNSTGPTYNWFTDSGLSSSIASPVNYSSGSTTVYIEVIDANSCSNNIGVDLLVNPLPTVVTTTIEECNTGSNQATFNLNAVESIVNGGTANSVLWYSDAALTTSITTPGTYLTNSTTVYAEVTDVNVCTNSTPITLTVNALPMAIDQNPAGICEDTPGAGSSTIDLTIYETSINSTGTVTINWFSDVNLTSPIVSSNSTTASDGDIFYAQVIENSTSCEDTAAVTITILAAPSSNDITPSICEDILGSGQTANVDLTANNTAINGGSGLTYNWFIDPTLVTSVPDETNATINNGDVFYVEVDNGNCVSVAQVTYSVTSTITLNDPTPAMCESTSGSGQTSNFDLTSLNTSVYTGGGSTVYNWLESDMTTSVATPNDVTISNGDQYYLEVVDGNCSNTIMITMTVNSLPTMSATSGLELCDDGTGNAQFDLTALESGINGTGPTYNWYSDVSLSNTIATPSTYSAGSSTVYLEVTDINSCSNNISVDLTVNALPTANTGSITLCDDGTGQATFDLTSLESSVNGGTANSVSWFNDQALTSSVSTPSSLTTASTSVYAEVTDATTSCVNSIDVTLTVTSLPTEPILSNDATYCDGSAMIDLTATGNGGTLTWFDDAAMTNVVGTGNSFSPINNLGSTTYYVTEDLGGCISNSSSVTVTINSNPIADFSATPTSGSPELLVNYTDNSTGAGLIYNWEFGDNNTSAIQNPSNTFTTAGSYTTVLTVTDLNGCTDSTSIIITVDGEPSVLIIPNIFSPNGDESNDVFNISGTNIISISGTIMNRWGQVVFEFDTLEAGWDGRTVSGLEASEGTYYYLINAEGGDGVIYNYQGPFELVR